MRWGDSGRYKIRSMTDRYITGLQENDNAVDANFGFWTAIQVSIGARLSFSVGRLRR